MRQKPQVGVILAEGGDPDRDLSKTAFMAASDGKRSGCPPSASMTAFWIANALDGHIVGTKQKAGLKRARLFA